jgi:hypothetical protein
VRSRSAMRRSISAFTAPPESPASVGGTPQIVAAPRQNSNSNSSRARA